MTAKEFFEGLYDVISVFIILFTGFFLFKTFDSNVSYYYVNKYGET